MSQVPGIGAPALDATAGTQANGAAGGDASSASAAVQSAQQMFEGLLMSLVQQQMSNTQDSMDAF
jgi:hypothetical protein